MIKQTALLLLLLALACAQQGSLQVTPLNSVLYANSNYQINYYTVRLLPATATFLLDFTNTYVVVPNAVLNITASVGNNPVSNANGTCSSNKCTLKLNNQVAANGNLTFIIGSLQNPYFSMNQTLTTNITFNTSYSQNLAWTILASSYTPMSITLNSMSQSNYGVGNRDVTYTFNLSLPMTPVNPQLTITFPSQVGIGNLQSTLTFFGNIQNINPIVFGSNAVFPIITSANNASSGIIYLTMSGLINPQSIGTSSSFVFLLQLPSLPNAGGSCSSCNIAAISNNLLAKSTVPGNIITLSMNSSNNAINQENNITIYTQLMAPIPQGGMYQITLPSGVQPALPINCMNIYAFTLTSGSPSCSYNTTSNSIYTNNFYFSGIGNVVFGVTVINPTDTRQVSYTFQTFDSAGNMIGNSAQPTAFMALPLLLNANPTKNITQVSTNYKLTVSLTLGVALTQSDFVKVILPQASYKTSDIVCISGGINVPCSSTIDSVTNNLTVSLAPPCSQCTPGATLSFAIDNLLNPSFVSGYSQSLIIQTAHPQGIVEQLATNIVLSLATVTVSNYARNGLSTVGSAYTMSFTYSIPPYIAANGGLLQINFVPYDSYIKVSYNASQSSYNYPASLSVTDSTGNSYSNSILYDTTSSPNSVNQIVISICGSNPCSNTLTITGLLRGYNPLTAMTQSFLLTTQAGDPIASYNFSIMQFNPTKATNNLALTIPNSVTTLNSNYVIDFVSSYIPFQSGITFSLSYLQSINGGCFMIDNSTIYEAVFTCSVVNSTSIQISINGDATLMMLDIIGFTITITNVTNPPTIQPITYSFNTQFNSVISQTYSTTYAIQNPLPLSLSYSRSNSTYAQSASLTLTLTSTYPTFTEIKLNAPSSLLTVVSASNYTTTLSNSIFQVSQINTLTNKALTVNIVNPSSTAATGNIVVGMYYNGYLTASGTVTLPTVVPVYLGVSATTTNSIVGNLTDLAVNFNRVNPFSAQSSFVFNLSPTLFNLTSAQYNGNPLTLPLTLPISTTSIVINNVQNLLSIPTTPQTTALLAWTIDSSSNKVAQSAFNSANLAPKTPTTALNFNFVRSNTAISGTGALVISYSPRFASVSSTMSIVLPANQAKMTSPTCQIQTTSGLTPCQVISSNTSAITIGYNGQSQTILGSVVNQQPNQNLLQVSVYNPSGELIQTTSGAITPAIQLNQMAVYGQTSSSTVASNTQLAFSLSLPSSLNAVNKLVINIPNATYLKISNLYNQDCAYTVSNTSFNTCSYTTDGNGWLTQVNLTNLGSTQILASTNVTINLYVINSWISSTFSSTPITFYVCSSTDNYLAQGSIQLSTLYGGATSFSPSSVSNFGVDQGGMLAGSQNNLTISFTLNVPTPQNTVFQLNIPKSSYNLNLNSLQTSLAKVSTSESSTYYTIQLMSPCTQNAPICMLANTLYKFWVVTNNNQYLQLNRNPISLQVILNTNSITKEISVLPAAYTPLTFTSPSITRSNKQANQATSVTFKFNTLPVATFQLIITPMTTSSGNVLLVNSPTFSGFSSTQSLTYTTNSSGHITVNVNGASNSVTSLVINGTNSFLVPVTTQKYTLTAMDSNNIYFQSLVSPSDTLVPYASGVALQRLVTTVGLLTPVYLSGTLPQSISQMSVVFNSNSYTVSSSSFNISLGSMNNPTNQADNSTVLVVIKNNDLIAYSSQLTFTPALTSQNLTAFTSLTVSSTMNVSQNYNLSLALNNYQASFLEIVLPVFIKSLTTCCIDTACSQTNISSCTFTTSDSKAKLSLNLKASQNITSVVFRFTALDYQISFTNSPITINSGFPSASYATTCSVQLLAKPLQSTLSVSSWRVNAKSNYNLWIAPNSQAGYIGITLPIFITSQLNDSSVSYALYLNGAASNANLVVSGAYNYVLPVNSTITNVTLLISSLTNPLNSAPYTMKVDQAYDTTLSKVYATNTFSITMNEFDPITVSSATRDITKVSQLVSLSLNITTPNYKDDMIINFPSSQQYTNTNCTVVANSQTLPCQVINSTAIKTTNIAGANTYVVTGLSNQKYFSLTASTDLVQVSLGNPYSKARTITSSTTYITPSLTLGSVIMQGVTSSSSTSLSFTNLLYNFTIQNTGNIDGFILTYTQYSYYLPTTITCKLNGNAIPCNILAKNQLFITTTNSFPSPKMTLQVNGIVNYIKTGNWSIRSVQKQANSVYSDVDVYYSTTSGVSSMSPNSLSVRVIAPRNYVQTKPVTVLVVIDSIFDYLPMQDFRINLTFSGLNCQTQGTVYISELTLQCNFDTPLTSNIDLQLYHSALPTNLLALATKTLAILPSPTSNCANQMCDSCSIYNSQEFCYVCREGMVSYNGQCMSSCPAGQFPYANTYICSQCHPSCKHCFGYTINQCMGCTDSSLVLSSGTCRQSCPFNSMISQGNCVQSAECTSVDGCRLCSTTGFCYECLPDYLGAPTCQYKNPYPATFFTYILAPFAGIAIITLVVALAKCGGVESGLSQTIFSFSFLQLFAWILTVPVMPTLMASMVLISFLALRMIISIVSYEVYYRKNLGDLSQKLLEEESNKQSQKSDKQQTQQSNLDNFKTKFARFMAHFNGPDSYELLKSRICEPVLSVTHNFAINVLFMVNRWIVGVLMFYAISVGKVGDSILMPAAVLASSGVISLSWLFTWDKFKAFLLRCRS